MHTNRITRPLGSAHDTTVVVVETHPDGDMSMTFESYWFVAGPTALASEIAVRVPSFPRRTPRLDANVAAGLTPGLETFARLAPGEDRF